MTSTAIEAWVIVACILSSIFGACLSWLHFRNQLKIERINLEKAKENELSVVAFTFKDETGDGGLVMDTRTAVIGYQYQLFIKGIPCFEPLKVPLQTLSKKDISPEKIEKALSQALGVVEAIAAKHPAIQIAKSAQKVIK